VSDELLDKLTDFVQKYLPYRDRNLIRHYIELHEGYNTIDYAIDDRGEIIGLCRWNVSKSGTVGHILDLVIRPDWRGRGLARSFLIRALKRFPKGKYLTFEREKKYPNREQRYIPIEQILKRSM